MLLEYITDHVFLVNYVAVLVKILPPLRADSDWPFATIVSLEEVKGIAAGDNACALVL